MRFLYLHAAHINAQSAQTTQETQDAQPSRAIPETQTIETGTSRSAQSPQNESPQSTSISETFTIGMLKAAKHEQIIYWLGNRPHPLISAINPDQASKITGTFRYWSWNAPTI